MTTPSSRPSDALFKWACLLVAVVALAAFGWMLNDIRMDIKKTIAEVDDKLPRILAQTERVTSELDRTLPQVLAETKQVGATVNQRLPQLLNRADAATENVVALTEDLQQFKGALAGAHAASQNPGLLGYATGLLDLVGQQKATVGVKSADGPALKQPVPAKAWADGARKDARFQSLASNSKAEVLRAITKQQSSQPWYIHLENQAPELLFNFVRRVHKESENLE